MVVVTHFPLTLSNNEPRCDCYNMEVEHTDNVGEFKTQLAELSGLARENLTLCQGGQVRHDDDTIWTEPLAPVRDMDKIFLHVRVKDPELERKIAELRAQMGNNFFVPLDQVTMKPDPQQAATQPEGQQQEQRDGQREQTGDQQEKQQGDQQQQNAVAIEPAH